VRTPALLTRLLPWNWARDDAAVRAMAAFFERGLTGLRLAALPRPPVFAVGATDMAFGVGFVFSRRRMGDWRRVTAGLLPTFPSRKRSPLRPASPRSSTRCVSTSLRPISRMAAQSRGRSATARCAACA